MAKCPFKAEQPAIAWYALCKIIGNEEKPNDGQVDVGSGSGATLPMSAVHDLDKTFKTRPDIKTKQRGNGICLECGEEHCGGYNDYCVKCYSKHKE